MSEATPVCSRWTTIPKRASGMPTPWFGPTARPLSGMTSWWGTLPQAVMAFLEEYDFTGKTIVPFCSHGGSRLGRGPQDIAALCPGAELLDGLAVSGSAVSGAQADVQKWLNGLNLKL